MTTEPEDVIEARLRLLLDLENAIRAMRDVLEPAIRGLPLEAERRLAVAPRVLEELDSLASQVTDMHSWRLVREELELRAAQTRMDFGGALERAFNDSKIPWTGSFPTYRLWRSLRVDVIPAETAVRVGRRTFPMGSADEIVRALLASRKTASKSETPKEPQLKLGEIPVAPTAESMPPKSAGDFEQEIQAAYASSALSANVSPGDYVAIGKLYDALKPRMPRGYSRARFARDLGAFADKSQSVEFAASRHPRHGMRVPPGDGNLVGSVRLRRP